MKLETIYKGLTDFRKTNNFEKLNNLIDKIEQAVLVSAVKTPSSKARLNAMIRYAKKQKNRPVLSKAPFIDGKQVFTDSYFLVKLVGDDVNTAMDSNLDGATYPNTDGIVDRTVNGENLFKFNVAVKDLLQVFKVQETASVLLYDDIYITFHRETMKQFITFMNYKNSDVIDFTTPINKQFDHQSNEGYYNRSSAFTTNKNGSFGLILPTAKVNKENVITPLKES